MGSCSNENIIQSIMENVIGAIPKKHAWTMPAVLGLVISIVGAFGAIELRPQISVSPMEPFEKSQPFSVPFRIQNIGYFGFWVEEERCVIGAVDFGGIRVEASEYSQPTMGRHYVDRGESMTVSCYLMRAEGPTPKAADIAILVYYRPWRTFPHTFSKPFRFIGAYGDSWQWMPQPSDFGN